ncbi:PP2C family protein-serine/threonine phosphatase [Oerskovia sp. M15]
MEALYLRGAGTCGPRRRSSGACFPSPCRTPRLVRDRALRARGRRVRRRGLVRRAGAALGALALVVGDVTGHGLQAAAAMGQIRNALRAALVRAGTAHGAVEQLAETVQWTMPGQIATLVVAVVDLVAGTVEYVTAGHPPPFFLVPGTGVVWGRLLGGRPLGLRGRLSWPDT